MVACAPPQLALSIRQPWATLIVLGLKTIEIRRWSTPIRGRIYLHAGKIADDRREGWSRVPEEHFALTSRRGGLIGTIDLVECRTYGSVRQFARDRQLHFNEPSWFLPPQVYGFRFEGPAIAPFCAVSGQVKFFPVELKPDTFAVRSPAIATSATLDAAVTPATLATPATGRKRVTFELGPERRGRSRK
jgi:hypothetical protein